MKDGIYYNPKEPLTSDTGVILVLGKAAWGTTLTDFLTEWTYLSEYGGWEVDSVPSRYSSYLCHPDDFPTLYPEFLI